MGEPNIWQDLRDFFIGSGFLPGMVIETSLLGWVAAEKIKYGIHKGTYRGAIPKQLAYTASKNGFEIISADHKNNRYQLRGLIGDFPTKKQRRYNQ